MSSLNCIESKHIKQLRPHELVRLLSKLLYSEAKTRSAEVHVPLEIEVNDEGEDARWKGDIERNEYVPNRFTLYQSKAQALSPSACKAELLKTAAEKTQLKESVVEVLDAKGCYVFFCGHPSNPSLIKRKIEEARKGLKQAGRTTWKTDRLLFLDANKIAAWTNLHTSAVVFVAECCAIRLPVNFRTWDNWHKDRANHSRFYSNAKLDQYAANLRAHLTKPRSIARISGLSGLGKTRLAFETLRPPDDLTDVQRQTLSHTTAYIDVEENNQQEVFAIARQLADAGYTGTLVVDNCERTAVHDKLAEIINMEGSRLSLLTLDYEPEKPPMVGFLHIPLESEMMKDVIPSILEELPQARMLTEQQRQHIASFANGFPQIAVLMAAAGDTLDWARLNQGRLAQKIAHGRDAPTDKSRLLIRSLALFTHVGFDGRVTPQREFVREHLCQNIPEHEFLELCKPFRQRRVLQSAGDFAFVAPPPLAVALAADWWESATEQQLIQLFPQMEKCGLRPYFCNQVERLHFSQNAQAIAAKLCGANGPLSNAEVLNSEAGSQLFRAMVELNPSAALDCAYRVFATRTQEEILMVEAGRRNLIWALEKLCWERANFPRAAELLLDFAAAENETWGNNATGQFTQLFHLVLSGTQAPALERLEVIENGLQSGQSEKRKVCIQALGSALKSQFFSRSGGVEVRGSGPPQMDWQPNSFREMADYWVRVVNILKTVILEKSSEAVLAKEVLGDNLHGVLMPPFLNELEPAIKQIAEAEDRYWPEALSSLKMILAYDKDRQNPDSLARLNNWTVWLTPEDLEHRLDLVVAHASPEDREGPDGQYVDVAAENARKLADEILASGQEWTHLLPTLLQGEQRQSWAFGQRLGEMDTSPTVFISKCTATLRNTDSEKRNVSLLAGFLAGLRDRELATRTLEAVANDNELRLLLPGLTVHSAPQKRDIERVAHLVLMGLIDPNQLRVWRYWGVMRSLSSREVITILEPITQQKPEGRAAVYDILSMYTFQSEQRWQECRQFIKQLLCSEGFLKGLNLSQDSYHWQGHALKLLAEEEDPEFAINQTRQILEIATDNDRWLAADRDAKKVLGEILRRYANACWPFVGKAILSNKFHMLSTLFKCHEVRSDPSSILWEVPTSIVVDWAAKHPSAVLRILGISALFTTNEAGSYTWHPTILKLLEQPFDDRWEPAIGANLYSFGSWGSRVPYVKGRIALLKQLSDHPSGKVRSMAKSLIARFEKDKEHQEKWDEERMAGILGPPPL